MISRITLFLLCVVSAVPGSAQFIFGWSGGYANPRELNREIYIYNAINGHALSKEMNAVRWYQGPVIGFGGGSDGFYGEVTYNRKRVKVESEWDSAGVTMNRQLKVLCNTYNFGMGYNTGAWIIGASFDIGRFKGKGRRGPAADIGNDDWERLWVLDNRRLLGVSVYRLYIMETVFVEKKFSDLAGLRFYAQFNGVKCNMDALDYWMFGGNLNFANSQKEGFINFGAALIFHLGR